MGTTYPASRGAGRRDGCRAQTSDLGVERGDLGIFDGRQRREENGCYR
jgi:hypothetical protein